ncbi:MAG: CRISPR-associated ring nuclease Csm6 [Acidithiobacillus sp.]
MNHSVQPSDYAKRILLVVTGMSPQILTETLWGLTVADENPFVPTEIHVITTLEGAERARLLLLSEDPGWFQRLRRDYQLPEIAFSTAQLHVITNREGMAMSDIRTPEDNEAAADFITDWVRQLTADPDCALHVSLAGGRKTMGYYLGYALSLYGRAQDRLSHVLVSEGYESSPDFFYPTPYERIILVGPQRKPLDCAQAQIDRADIPFVRLRDDLPSRFMTDHVHFTAVVQATNRALQPPKLVLNRRSQQLLADDQEIPLTPIQFALYWWMAESIKQEDPYVDWASAEAAVQFLKTYRQVVSEFSADYDDAEVALEWRIKDPRDVKSYFATNQTRANQKFSEILGQTAAQRYQIHKISKRSAGQLYTLHLEPEQIEIL